jgi:hypothetical protein
MQEAIINIFCPISYYNHGNFLVNTSYTPDLDSLIFNIALYNIEKVHLKILEF